MTATVTNNGDGTLTIGFAYTHDAAKITDTLEAAVQELLSEGMFPSSMAPGPDDIVAPPLYDDLTNTQRLDVIDTYIKTIVRRLAGTYYVKSQMQAAARPSR